MHNKKIVSLLFTAIIILIISLILSKDNEVKQIINQAPNPKVETSITSKKSVQQIVREKNKRKIDNNTVQVIDSVYDDDPVVDANLIIENNRLCISYLTYDKNRTKKYLKRFENILNPKQIEYYQNLYDFCQKHNQQHPEYHLSDIKTLLKQKQQAQANSKWGKIIKGEIDVSTLDETEIAGLLKQNNPSILKQAPKYLADYYAKVIHWDIEDVLNNHQYNYTQLIQQYAHQLYVCQLGSDCGPNSSVMSTLCYLNAQSCGLDFPQFVQQSLTQGQQADIQLTMDYLNNIYQ
jgi:hypothetical protein